MTFVYLGSYWESVPIPRKSEYQTARTSKPYQCWQMSASTDWCVPNHSDICNSYVASLGGTQKRVSMSKYVLIGYLLNDLPWRSVGEDSWHKADRSAVQDSCPEVLLGKCLLGMSLFPWGDSIQVLEGWACWCGHAWLDVECWDWYLNTLYFSSCKNFIGPLHLVCYPSSSVRSAQASRLQRDKTSVYKMNKCRNATQGCFPSSCHLMEVSYVIQPRIWWKK